LTPIALALAAESPGTSSTVSLTVPGLDDPVSDEPTPILEDGAFVGWRAIVGAVKIGVYAYVCADALFARDAAAG
jgi:hypothetical protein